MATPMAPTPTCEHVAQLVFSALPVTTAQDVVSDLGGELPVQAKEARPAHAQQKDQRSLQALGACG